MAIDHNVNANAARYLSDLQSAVPAPPAMIVPVFLDVITAVDALHRKYKTVSNLKPDKIVLLSNGKVIIEPQSQLSAATAKALPSLKYSSPEMLEEVQGVYAPNVSDSYVLGFMFYEILLGRDLFQRQFAEVLREGEIGWPWWHLDQYRPAHSLSSQINDFPSALSRLIDGMMNKRPAERMSDLRSIWETLAGSLKAAGIPKEVSTKEHRRKTWKILSFIKGIVERYIKAVQKPLTKEDEEDLQGLSM